MGSISVDNMYENLCNILKAQGRVEKISKSFSEMTNDNDRVTVVYNLLADMQLLPSFQKLKIRSKNASESTRLRNEGNKLFQRKNDNEALKLYTQSIMCAPVSNLNESNSTDSISLGFANRSAVLFAKEKFEDCLKDIERAFEYEYPTKLRYKLLERKAKCCYALGRLTEAEKYSVEALKCLSLAEGLSEEKRLQIEKELREFLKLPIKLNFPESSSPDLSHELPEKTYDQHPQIPCASLALKICYNPDMGRYVEAAENIRPGDILLVERPYASVLLPEFHSSHCSLCLRHSWSPVPCLHCTTVVYCSPQCRARAWELSHQVECSVLPALEQLDAGKFSLLSLRIVLIASCCGNSLPTFLQQLEALAREEASANKATLGFDANGLYYSDAYGPIYHLVGNTETRTAGDLFRRAVTAACVLDCLQRMSSFFQTHGGDNGTASAAVGGVLLRHLQNLPCNAHEVTEYVRMQSTEGHHVAESIEIGAAAYATLSLLNHGCDPGVVRHSVAGDCVVLRALLARQLWPALCTSSSVCAPGSPAEPIPFLLQLRTLPKRLALLFQPAIYFTSIPVCEMLQSTAL
ncbi:Uncharacterized protein GBIM_01812 [Gryllus bimaculatus]|nr:Uncharacterized protein GBIM_01812 [Gryllus bimaculatus]